MRKIKDITDAECLKALDLNERQGEGPTMIAGVLGCGYNTADAAITRGRKLAASNERLAKAFNDSGVFAPFTVVGKD